MASRVGLGALRRSAAMRPAETFFTQNSVAKTILTSKISTTPQLRAAAPTQHINETSAHDILAAQRLRRPVSPHLQIYKLDQTWFGGSAWMRITGASLSGGMYVFGAAYLVAPLLGWHLESASLAAAFGSLPVAVKSGLKFLIAWPFVFHSVNGVRHLAYDMGWGYSKKDIVRYGWVFWGLSAAGALGLVAFV